jgi:allantoicase
MKAYAVPFEKFVNLADARLGTKIISVTDDWFADANRLFQPTPAVWKEGVFDDNGKWMDGWESRRKRFEGFDSAVIRLGVPGSIKGVDIDTSFFTGNFPPSASLEACFLASG